MKKRIALALLGALLVMASAPTLEKRHHKYFLRFTYTEEVTLTKTPVKEQIICSVDLGS